MPMNMVIDSGTLDRIIFTARAMHARLQARMPADTDIDGIVAASMPAIIALATSQDDNNELTLAAGEIPEP